MKPSVPQCNFTRIRLVAIIGVFIFAWMIVPAFSQENKAAPSAAQAKTVPSKEAAPASSEVAPAAEAAPFVLPGKPIVVQKDQDPFEDRFSRMITLDVREMNVIDVIKFLSLNGDFNMVTSGAIEGRVTLYLKNVSIKDALDIILISNSLAYYVENSIVHIMPAPDYEAMFGKKFNDKLEVAIVKLRYAKPSYALTALENLKSSLGRVIIDEDTGTIVMIDTPKPLSEMQKSIENIDHPSDVVVYSLQYAKAVDTAEKLKARVDALAVGSVTADERSNKIIIRALPDRRAEVEAMLKELDVPTKEVLIEAKILQIVLKPQFDIGVDWEATLAYANDPRLNRLRFKNIFLNEGGLSTSDNVASNFTRIGYGDIDTQNFEFAIRALKQVSDTRILSNPKIIVTNNEEAKIHIGDTVPYIISTTSGTGDNAITSEDVRFVDVGLKLTVKPTINDDGFVTIHLVPEISTVVTKVTSKGGGIPQVNKTIVDTTVMVKDGTTIILGGLKKDNKVHTRKGIPFLMDVPFVNKFFSRTADSIEKTETIILITPHILKGSEDLSKLGGDIKPSKDFNKPSKELPETNNEMPANLQLKE